MIAHEFLMVAVLTRVLMSNPDPLPEHERLRSSLNEALEPIATVMPEYDFALGALSAELDAVEARIQRQLLLRGALTAEERERSTAH
jgi:hypothetical protein